MQQIHMDNKMHQFWETAKHIIDIIMAAVTWVTLIQIFTLATTILSFLGACLSVIWYCIRIREYLKQKKEE